MVTRRSFIQSLGFAALMPAGLQTASAKNPSPASVPGTLRLIQYCDPQLGFGMNSMEATTARLNKAVERINELKPDVTVFLGDLMHNVSESPEPMTAAIKKIESPVMIAPGNHDIPDPVTAEGMAFFRQTYGPDRSSALINGWKLIALNTQLWRECDPAETAAQEKWLDEELAGAKEAGTPVILMSHIPPYVSHPGEPDEWTIIPNANGIRMKLLEKAIEHGVRFWLAGHTHALQMKAFEGLVLLNGETTSINFDKRPYGVRLLTAEPDGNFTWNFIPAEV